MEQAYSTVKHFLSTQSGKQAITLVAVSKTKPISDIQRLYALGQRDFGENYAQELVDKAHALSADIKWHFIGTLQSNKCKLLCDSMPLGGLYAVHGLDSVKKADLLNKHFKSADIGGSSSSARYRLNVFLQVNTSNEDSKSGVDHRNADELIQLAKHVYTACPNLSLAGLMTIGYPSSSSTNDSSNPDFEKLRTLRDIVERELSLDTGSLGLSMGMSDDYQLACQMGSTCIRVGSLLFGARTYPPSENK